MKILKKLTALIIVISIIGALLIGVAYIYFRGKIDFSSDEILFESSKRGNITKLYYDSDLSDEEYSPALSFELKPTGNKKIWYSYNEIGENLKKAFISIEDRKFFSHNGIDIKRTFMAFLNVFTKSKPTFGASTITQQVIKNISGDDEKKISRKVAEIIRALHLEKRYSKEEIFEVYLNIVPMGDGIGGVGLASRYYFGKEPAELTLSEAAVIAGITNAPAKYNPRSAYSECLKRRNVVLAAMLDNEAISEEEYNEALNEDIVTIPKAEENNIYSWFTETVLDELTNDFMIKYNVCENTARIMIQNGGYSIYTTENPKIQKILESRFDDISSYSESLKEGLNYSMVVCDSKNSYLLGIVGSAKKKDANRIMNFALTNETPGSVLKPLAIYAPLIDEGKITWSTVFDDTPVYFYENSKGVLTPYPKNYPDVYSGLTTVSDALAFSKNTVAVKLYKMSDKNKIFRLLKNSFKFDCLVEEETVNGKVYSDLSEAPLALGQLTHGVSLRKLTEAYTVFPRDGVFSEGKSYIYVYDAEGNLVIDKSKSDEERIFKSKTAEIMNKLLSRVTEIGTAKIITLDQTVDTAGKTGTSGNDKDRMFIGYTPYFTAGIWCGYEKNDKSIGKQPKSHIEIWDDIMKDIHSVCINTEIEKSFSENSIVYLPYCKDSGKIFTDTCMLDPRGSRLDYGYFDIHNIPREMCDRHIECLYDEIAGGVANDNCPYYYTKKISLLNIPERSFPMEIIITDAEFVWREMKGDNYAYSYDIPYFYYDLPEGVYVGRSKSKKQFNSYCYIHSD